MTRQITAISVVTDPAEAEGQTAPEAPAAVETSPTAAAHPCDVCPTRSTAEDVRFDYCEGCTKVERYCPGCRRYKPQSGWWWGADWGHVDWMCADCRFPPPDAAAAARNPAMAASHPAPRELIAGRDRFTARLELDDLERRLTVAQALGRSAQLLLGDEAALVLGRMAAELRDAGFAGTLDVDVSDVDVLARQRVTLALHNASYSAQTPQAASEPLARLERDWERWAAGQLPTHRRALSERELRERERAAVRRGRERVIG